jgi:hypothetical protein
VYEVVGKGGRGELLEHQMVFWFWFLKGVWGLFAKVHHDLGI